VGSAPPRPSSRQAKRYYSASIARHLLFDVYHKMWGPSEFHVTSTLKGWDVRDRLGEIQLPTLVTSGRYDEATPAIAQTVHRGISGSELVIFEQSSHVAHLEEDAEYRRVVEDFMRRVERQA
jgi:proline-specific peptidase